jgi:hypothetical protein
VSSVRTSSCYTLIQTQDLQYNRRLCRYMSHIVPNNRLGLENHLECSSLVFEIGNFVGCRNNRELIMNSHSCAS